MNEHEPQPLSASDHQQLVALLEGVLTEDEFAELETRLREDADLRCHWIRLRAMDDALVTLYQTPREPQNHHGSRMPLSWLAIAALCLLVAILVPFVFNGDSSSHYHAVNLDLGEVAQITKMEGVTWAAGSSRPLAVGSLLKPGTIELSRGTIELTFLSGASLFLEGPSELSLLSPREAHLRFGRAAAQVPPEATGFIVKTPDSAVVDLGTEFGLSVDRNGQSQVNVYDGEVRVSLLGNDGSTMVSKPITTGESFAFLPKSQQILPTSLGDLPRVAPSDLRLLITPEAFQHQVRMAKPLIHWTFDPLDDSDESFEIHGPGIRRLNENQAGALYFEKVANTSRYVKSLEPLQLEASDYSTSLWVKPSGVQYATLFALCTEELETGRSHPFHQAVIELMHQSHLIHRPNSIRSLHRWNEGEVNLFSAQPFIPGRWHQIVCVKEGSKMRLYLNGVLSRALSQPAEPNTQPFLLVLGQIDHLRSLRQFQGIIDEFAFYPRALSTLEVEEQYRSMTSGNPDLFH